MLCAQDGELARSDSPCFEVSNFLFIGFNYCHADDSLLLAGRLVVKESLANQIGTLTVC